MEKTETNLTTSKEQMESALYEMLGSVIKEFQRRLTEEPEKIKASMFGQIIHLLHVNGINIQSMSSQKAGQIMDELAQDLDWSEWQGEDIYLPPAEEPIPARVN